MGKGKVREFGGGLNGEKGDVKVEWRRELREKRGRKGRGKEANEVGEVKKEPGSRSEFKDLRLEKGKTERVEEGKRVDWRGSGMAGKGKSEGVEEGKRDEGKRKRKRERWGKR